MQAPTVWKYNFANHEDFNLGLLLFAFFLPLLILHFMNLFGWLNLFSSSWPWSRSESVSKCQLLKNNK